METEVNAAQIAYWNETAGPRWARLQERIDGVFTGITGPAIDLASPREGERVLDVGCGSGTTTFMLAERIGSSGAALGIDVSQPMLGIAQDRLRRLGLHNVRFVLADAAGYPFEPNTVDLLFSRFGVMFFDEPAKAFANMRRAMRPGGRVAFVCWRSAAEIPFFSVPTRALLPLAGPQPALDPEAPGPVSFGDPDRVQRILARAGYGDVRLEAFDVPLLIGKSREEAVDTLTSFGHASRLVDAQEPPTRQLMREALDAALRAHETSEGVQLGAAVWLVSARAG